MKRLLTLVPLAGAAICASVALATPANGTKSNIMSIGTLNGDVAFNTGLPVTANGLTWGTKHYNVDRLPEFLLGLRAEGVTSLGDWLNLHPAVSAAFGLMPIGVLHSPEIVTQTVNFPPGAASGWHTHPGFLVSTELTGTLTKYATDCSSQSYSPGQSSTRRARTRSSSRTRRVRLRATSSRSSSPAERRPPPCGSTSHSRRAAVSDGRGRGGVRRALALAGVAATVALPAPVFVTRWGLKFGRQRRWGLSGPRSLERGESFAGAAGERDDLLAFVKAERLSISGRGFVDAPSGFERLSRS